MTPQKKDKPLATLRWFVFRARRVAEHSLVVDRDRLFALAQGSMKVEVIDGRPSRLSMSLPDEEQFESLAGRVRPFLMQRDDLHFKKVLAAFRTYISGDAVTMAAVDKLEEQWARYDPKSGATLGYATRIGETGGPLGDLLSDTTLADAWLYCDFGHGDIDVTDRVGSHDLESRYAAAVLLISGIAIYTLNALKLIQDTWKAELLPLAEADFTKPVLAPTELSYQVAGVASGPAGTPVKELEAALDRSPNQA